MTPFTSASPLLTLIPLFLVAECEVSPLTSKVIFESLAGVPIFTVEPEALTKIPLLSVPDTTYFASLVDEAA